MGSLVICQSTIHQLFFFSSFAFIPLRMLLTRIGTNPAFCTTTGSRLVRADSTDQS